MVFTFLWKKADLRNRRKLAARNKQYFEEHPRYKLAQNSNVPRSKEDYITQVSEEVEGRIKKKLSQESSRTENRTLGAVSHLDDFLMNPLIQGQSGTTPETSRNTYGAHQGTNKDDSQSDPDPKAGLLRSLTTRNAGPEFGHDNIGCKRFVKVTRHCLPNMSLDNLSFNDLGSFHQSAFDFQATHPDPDHKVAMCPLSHLLEIL